MFMSTWFGGRVLRVERKNEGRQFRRARYVLVSFVRRSFPLLFALFVGPLLSYMFRSFSVHSVFTPLLGLILGVFFCSVFVLVWLRRVFPLSLD